MLSNLSKMTSFPVAAVHSRICAAANPIINQTLRVSEEVKLALAVTANAILEV
jgi:hypothetical protein